MTGGAPEPVFLALDAAGLGCSVAVAAGDRLLGAKRIEDKHGQAEALLPMVDTVMREAGLTPACLDFVVPTLGPGSFTGVRVAIAAARGISLGTGARLVGVTSFEAVAAAALCGDRVVETGLLIALESRREDLYVQFFDRLCNPIGEPAAVMPERLGELLAATIGTSPLLVAGDAAERAARALLRHAKIATLEGSPPDAKGAWRAALRRLRRGDTSGAARPLYLRAPGVTFPGGSQPPDLGPA